MDRFLLVGAGVRTQRQSTIWNQCFRPLVLWIFGLAHVVHFHSVATAQVVSNTFDGVNLPIRVEFWNPEDGSFDWSPNETYRSGAVWTQDEIAAVERAVQYWWDVLGENNTPGRTITFRVLRDGDLWDGSANWVPLPSATDARTQSVDGVAHTVVQQAWAESQATPESLVADAMINLQKGADLTQENHPIQLVEGDGLEWVMIHEIAHDLGMVTGEGVWGPSGELTQFETMVVHYDENFNLRPVTQGDTFDHVPGDPTAVFFFNGPNAVEVYGAPVPLTIDSLQQSHLGIDAFSMTHNRYRNYLYFS